MRFHDFDFVKRSIDSPVIKSYHVDVAVRHRGAIRLIPGNFPENLPQFRKFQSDTVLLVVEQVFVLFSYHGDH